ncbi:hypothetical protein DVQ33_18090 [Yersinia enterocolitica]|nr:hypothetical protein [Yersinia enterocolitica]PHZ30486.1 hypothetical protein CS537_17160 [Yersinia mollaretii]EKN6114324.1 hypothetical protein [Yersinia enterocolitica]EKN6297719.1 hypothetical protein [Yersinia enterocolitica]CNE74586.1 Uncharacterised protein [Yersinia mollaretii]
MVIHVNIINARNIKNLPLSNYLNFKIKIVGISNRKGTSNSTNCSGFNINKYIKDGMTVQEYQDMVEQRFDHDNDRQYSLTKHLRYDIEKGHIELHSSVI